MMSTTEKIVSPPPTHCGFVAIIGAPNAGKSTLLNTLLGQKLAITSPKPQTTRSRILGILTQKQTQICLLDTPGIFAPKGRLDRAMVGAAWAALEDADAVCLIVDAGQGYDGKTRQIVQQLLKDERRVILVLNKVDAVAKLKILPLATELNATGVFTETFMISAKTGDGVKELKKYLAEAMPEGEWLFDADQLTDMPSSMVASEITREQIYHQLAQELPYVAAVVPVAWEDYKNGSVRIDQKIIVMRDGQKSIVIGNKGERLKLLGTASRHALEEFFGRKVHLFLEVAVEPGWQEKRGYYQMFGMVGHKDRPNKV
jgi:GTP-binding protein Era